MGTYLSQPWLPNSTEITFHIYLCGKRDPVFQHLGLPPLWKSTASASKAGFSATPGLIPAATAISPGPSSNVLEVCRGRKKRWDSEREETQPLEWHEWDVTHRNAFQFILVLFEGDGNVTPRPDWLIDWLSAIRSSSIPSDHKDFSKKGMAPEYLTD